MICHRFPQRTSGCYHIRPSPFYWWLFSSPARWWWNVSPADLCPDHLPFAFNSTCCVILDSVAPLWQKKNKHKPVPWFTDLTCTLRQQCRQAEWGWKDRLHVSLGLLRDCLSVYQINSKEKKSRYVSYVYHSQQSLLAMIEDTYKEFYDFICNKVASVGKNILIHSFLLRVCMFSLHSMAVFEQFETIYLVTFTGG